MNTVDISTSSISTKFTNTLMTLQHKITLYTYDNLTFIVQPRFNIGVAVTILVGIVTSFGDPTLTHVTPRRCSTPVPLRLTFTVHPPTRVCWEKNKSKIEKKGL